VIISQNPAQKMSGRVNHPGQFSARTTSLFWSVFNERQHRKGHPVEEIGAPEPFEQLLAYPIASTPLSDEVARILTERYGPRANPDDMVTLRCDDTATLVEVARSSDAIVLTIRAAGRDLVPLDTVPALNATARFGLVTLDHRAEVPGLQIVRELVTRLLTT
jgi:hypothetical protein